MTCGPARATPRPRTSIVACAFAAMVLAASSSGQAAGAAVPVGVIALPGSRLADDLKRELEISGFEVVVVAAPVPPLANDRSTRASQSTGGPADDWKGRARTLVTDALPRAVAIRADGRQLLVLSRGAGAGPAQTSFDLQIDPDDRPTRRRACLAVVEYLRVLVEDDDRTRAEAQPDAEAAREAPSERPSEVVAAVAVDSDDRMQPAPPPPPPTPSLRRLRPWTMGVASTVDVASTGGAPAAHVQFMWCFPVSLHLSLRVRAEWPVLGTDFQSGDTDVRIWSFGASVDLQVALAAPTARWRPFLGISVGNRLALTEASSPNPLQSSTAVTPSTNLGGEVGLSYALAGTFQIFVEVDVTRDWMLPRSNRIDYERAAANATAVHPLLGVLFEY